MWLEVIRDGVVVASGETDDQTMNAFLDERRIFEALIDSGVTRHEANRIMIQRMESNTGC